MLISVKTISQEIFQVDVQAEDTIKVVKEKIEKEKGKGFPADRQKLIYGGKILKDDQIVADVNIDAKKFMVIMISKAETSSTDADSDNPKSPAPRPSAAPCNAPKPSASASKATTAARPEPQTATGQTVPAGGPAEGARAGADYERYVAEIVNMGYPREQVIAAMRASGFDPNRAVDYLLSGAGGNVPQQKGTEAQPADDEEKDVDPLGELRAHPAFVEMRRTLQQNQNNLAQMLMRFGEENPQFVPIINANQEQIVQILSEPLGGEGGSGKGASSGQGQDGKAQSAKPDTTKEPAKTTDKDAIERLKAMGFKEEQVRQAYFACEKNENLAANLLLQQSEENDQQGIKQGGQ